MDLFDLFIQYWKIILLVLLLIINICISIFRRPKVLNTVMDAINTLVPNAVIEAEKLYGKGNGLSKLDYACNLVCDYICYRFNLSQKDLKKYDAFIKAAIEKVLSTPQKKGE